MLGRIKFIVQLVGMRAIVGLTGATAGLADLLDDRLGHRLQGEPLIQHPAPIIRHRRTPLPDLLQNVLSNGLHNIRITYYLKTAAAYYDCAHLADIIRVANVLFAQVLLTGKASIPVVSVFCAAQLAG